MNTLSKRLNKTLLILFAVFLMLGTCGIAQAQTPEAPTTPEPLGTNGETFLDTGGFLSSGTISGGLSWNVGGSLIVDGSYLRPIITLSPFELYSVTTLKAEVHNIGLFEYDAGVMQGFGLSYIGEEGIGFFAEVSLEAIYQSSEDFGVEPQVAIIFTIPSDALF